MAWLSLLHRASGLLLVLAIPYFLWLLQQSLAGPAAYRAVAYTLVLCGLAWNGAGALVLGYLGHIAWSWMPALLLGSLLGGYAGSHWALVKGNAWIKRSFEAITLVIGAKLAWDGLAAAL